MSENQKLREALRELMSIVSIHQSATRNNFAWAEMAFAREALALPTAEQVDDINVAESFTSVTKTAALVCEREAFEREMSKPPFEFCMDRWPDDGSSYAWPGNYVAYHTQCAWDAWQARAALSAGDAVDAQRTPLTVLQYNAIPELCAIPPSLYESVVRAIERAHGIDAAMRKEKP